MDGHGTILRLVEVGGENAPTRLAFQLFHVQQAWTTNVVEQNQSPLRVEGNLWIPGHSDGDSEIIVMGIPI
jgi:Glycosyl hydrolases family 38 C-terminal beta sandwich domain